MVAMFLLIWSGSEPRYQGKSISAWITQTGSSNMIQRQEAQTAIQTIGAKGQSWMLRRLNREEPVFEKLLRGDRSSGLLTDYDLRRARIASVLGSLGGAGAPAIPALELARRHPDWLIAAHAEAALMQIRQESSLPVTQTLTNMSNVGVWVRSACVLSALGTNLDFSGFLTTLQKDLPRAYETVQLLCTNHIDPAVSGPILVGCLRHKDWGVRGNTLNAMISQRSWGDAERDAIVQALFDPSAGVRGNAMFTLNLFPRSRLSATSTNLTSALNRAANDTDPTVRVFARELLRRLR